MSNIKSLLDEIINDTEKSYDLIDNESDKTNTEVKSFSKENFREKMSMLVLKDIVCAMMHDDVKDVDDMIDESIMHHIHHDYKGTCYSYLQKAHDNLQSPLIQNVIQEIDDTTEEMAEKAKLKKCDDDAAKCDVKDILKEVDNYEELRSRLKEKVSKKVVDDVAGVIATSNDAPVFDKLDEKLDKATAESMILKMSGKIVLESYAETKTKMDTEKALSKAIVEYCINEMDHLFKQNDMTNLFQAKYSY